MFYMVAHAYNSSRRQEDDWEFDITLGHLQVSLSYTVNSQTSHKQISTGRGTGVSYCLELQGGSFSASDSKSQNQQQVTWARKGKRGVFRVVGGMGMHRGCVGEVSFQKHTSIKG